MKIIKEVPQKVVQMVCGYIDLLRSRMTLSNSSKVIVYHDLSRDPELFDAGSRIPKHLDSLSKSLKKNARFPAGKIIQFETDSDVIDIHVLYKKIAFINNMKHEKASAVDVVCLSPEKEILYTLHSSSPYNMHVHKRIYSKESSSTIRIYLPSYAIVSKVYVGTYAKSVIKGIESNNKPIVFYGSSITQGCCASSPRKAYTNIVAEYYHLSQRNFGFSESAKGEDKLIEYIASIPASLYVLEYDHNASVELLNKTHYSVYSIIRKKNRNTPIIFLSRFSSGLSIPEEEVVQREKIIERTISSAYRDDDRNVFFVSGKGAIKKTEEYFVDDRHPNDDGMQIIANRIIECINNNDILVDENEV